MPTFLHEIEQSLRILFGLSAQVNIVYIFAINPDFNENDKEMP